MIELVPLEPVDYLVIGHITEDLTPSGPRLGGTAAFSALTARSLGLRVGVVSALNEETSLKAMEGILAKGNLAANHSRWHVKRGVVSSGCSLCILPSFGIV